MVRLSAETINDAYNFVNAVQQREISLRGLQIPAIENLGVTRDQFDVIDLTDNNIRKIENLPFMKRLDTLLLHNNRIQQIQKDIGEKLPNLKTLALTNNNVAELGDIEPLSKCLKLEYLSLMGNPLTHKPQYRSYVINKLPQVRVLDYRRVRELVGFLDIAEKRFFERKTAKDLFRGNEGKKLEEQLGKTTQPVSVNGDSHRAQSGRSAEELAKIEEAIRNAKTLVEVENLNNILQSGHVPGMSKAVDSSKNGIQEEHEVMES